MAHGSGSRGNVPSRAAVRGSGRGDGDLVGRGGLLAAGSLIFVHDWPPSRHDRPGGTAGEPGGR